MSHENSPGHETKPINTEGIVRYAEQCFGANVDLADFKYPRVYLLKDLAPLATKYPAGYMEDDGQPVLNSSPVQSIVTLVVESPNLAYAVIKIDRVAPDTLDSTNGEYVIVKILDKQQSGEIVGAGCQSSPRLENGALIIRPMGIHSQSVVFTNPKPDTQTDLKVQYHIDGRRRTAEAKHFKDHRQTYIVVGTLDEGVVEVGAPSEGMAISNANILRNYGLWANI